MGACHSSSKTTLKNVPFSVSKPATSNSLKKGPKNIINEPSSLNLIPPPQIQQVLPNERNNENDRNEQESHHIQHYEESIPTFDPDETFEMVPLKNKVQLKRSGLKVEDVKDQRILELVFSYKNTLEFTVNFHQVLEITTWQWELVNVMNGPNESLIYKVLDKKSGTRANLQIFEMESENEPQIAEISYQIYLNNRIKETLEKMLREDAHIDRKKKDSAEMREFLNDPPLLQIIDYYIFQEGFQHSLRPKKWLHVVWEEWDSTLRQIIESRTKKNKEKKYLEQEITYIGKTILYALSVLRSAKIAHRNINPRNIVYVNSSHKYKIFNFRLAKLTNLHKSEANRSNSESPIKKEELVSKHDRRTEFWSISKNVVTKTINDRNITGINKFEHSVVGTPYYMEPTLKEAYLNNSENARLLDGLFHLDLFAFALTMFELEALKKHKNYNAIIEENMGRTFGSLSVKAIILKIINSKIKYEDIVQKAHSKIGTIIAQSKNPTFSKNDKLTPEPELKNSKFDRIRKKKGFLLAGQILGKTAEDASRDKAAKAFNDYEKSKNGNIFFLLSYLRKVHHSVVDESEFLKNGLPEILKMEGEISKNSIFFKFYLEVGDIQKALEELLQAKEFLERNPDENQINRDLILAEIISEISRMHMLMGKYGTALSFLDDVRKLIENFDISEKIIELKKNTSTLRMIIYKNKGDLNLALKAAKKLISFIEKHDKARSTYELALAKEFVAEIYFLLDDNSQAMTNIQLALSYYREIELTQYTSMQLADALIFASQIYKCLLEIENSEAFLTEALVIYSSKYGENHPVVGYILLQLSQIYKDKANYAKSISHGVKALKVMRIFYYEEDDNVIEAVKNLSLIYKEAEDIHKSIYLLKESLDLMDKNRNPDSPCLLAENLYNLGLCYLEVNDYENARKYLRESLSIYNSNLVEDDLILNDILQKLTIVNFEMTKIAKIPENNPIYQEERTSFRGSVINKKKLNAQHYDEGNLVNSYINLADVLMMKNEFEKSLKLYLLALKIKKDSNYHDSKMNDILMKIGLIYLIAGKYEESLKYFQDCLKFICDISSDQLSEHIMRLNLIISHLYVILDQKPQAQEHNEKAVRILTHLRKTSKTIIRDELLLNHAQQYVSIDLTKERALDKNEILNDLMEILQIAFHYEESEISKLDSNQKMSLVNSIHQAQGEIYSKKGIEGSVQNISNDHPPTIKKMASLMYDSSYNRNFGVSLKSPQSFSSSHKGTSIGHSGSTPRFRGDSLIFKRKSYISFLPGEKNNENNGDSFFPEKNTTNISNEYGGKIHVGLKHERSLGNIFTTPKSGINMNKKSIGEKMGDLEEVRNESRDEDSSAQIKN